MSKKKAKKDMAMNVRYFFLNNPVEDVRKSLWDLYTQWVHGSDDTGSKQHSNMLLFYEYLTGLIEELDQVDQQLNAKQTIKHPIKIIARVDNLNK